jgi:hypothetical protein
MYPELTPKEREDKIAEENGLLYHENRRSSEIRHQA